MKVPLRWLSQYVDLTLPPDELAHRLTMAGAEVEQVERSGGDWQDVVVGEVRSVDPHPNADKLRLASVDYGADQPLTVVCGAPNVAVGQRVAFALAGARLIDARSGEPRKLRKSKIRGVESAGMVCSPRELGISDEHEGILALETDAPLGTPLQDVLGEAVLDITPTPNRPDHFSVLGIAREVAALTGAAVREPAIDYEEVAPAVTERTSVEIADPDLCPRYAAIVIDGVTVGASPDWLQQALLASGMRPINNVVDVTNYVLLETGQPLHAFDQETLHEGRIVVRRAAAAETMALLDGSTIELRPDDLVIADADRPVALAGIMGGSETEVGVGTSTILLEIANFDPSSIRRSAAAHKLRTEASLRFEKGLNPELVAFAARRAAHLLVELTRGRAAPGVWDAYPGEQPVPFVQVTQRRLAQMLGTEVPVERVRSILDGLGLSARWIPPDRYVVQAPPWRSDINVSDDIVEEIGRIIGYDELPSAPLSGGLPEPALDPVRATAEHIRDALSGGGLAEVLTYSTVGSDALAQTTGLDPRSAETALRLTNPMSAERDLLRPTLRPALLETFAANRREQSGPLQLFEIGKEFHPRVEDLPEERRTLAVLLGGASPPSVHGEAARPYDFFDAKAVAELLAATFGLVFDYGLDADADAALLPSVATRLSANGTALGLLGQLRPELAAAFEIDEPVFLIELDVAALAQQRTASTAVETLVQFPAAAEDLAFVVDASTPAAAVSGAISGQQFVEAVELFDVYEGEQVPAGKKSLAYRVSYRAPDRTLSERDMRKIRTGIIKRLEHGLGATLRD